jgi:hypothetical protein
MTASWNSDVLDRWIRFVGWKRLVVFVADQDTRGMLSNLDI